MITLHATTKEIEQFFRYASNYGSGGFQGLLHRMMQRSVISRLQPIDWSETTIKRR